MSQLTGWIPFKERTEETNKAHDLIMSNMSIFRILAGETTETEKIVLSSLWDHPVVIQALGFKFPRIRQLTGSCVGAGGANCQFTLLALEIIRLGDFENIEVPFWLYTYGKSRKRAGIRGRGDGSIGSAYAEAARLDGYISSNLPELPKFQNDDGLILSSDIEYKWSDGYAIDDKYSDIGKKHLVKSTSPCRNSDDVREAIRNGYPCTIACDYYIGSSSVKGSGDNRVTVGKFDNYGPHQTSIQGWWNHPELGELFNNQNNWNDLYQRDPAGGQASSVWMTKKDMDYACKNGEVFAFSQFEGFPAQKLDKSLFRIMG